MKPTLYYAFNTCALALARLDGDADRRSCSQTARSESETGVANY